MYKKKLRPGAFIILQETVFIQRDFPKISLKLIRNFLVERAGRKSFLFEDIKI